jgi:hypothetical protein
LRGACFFQQKVLGTENKPFFSVVGLSRVQTLMASNKRAAVVASGDDDALYAQLYVEHSPKDIEQVDLSFYEECKRSGAVVALPTREFDEKERVLKGAAQSVEDVWAAEHPGIKKQDRPAFTNWHKTEYTRKALLSKGFVRVSWPTIVAVDDGSGGLAVKIMYRPSAGVEVTATTLELGNYVLNGDKVAHPETMGQSLVQKRGGKAMGGTMLMFGSTNHYGSIAKHFSGSTETLIGVYKPKAKVDPHMLSLVSAHVDAMTRVERELTPAYAERRNLLMDYIFDPKREHRMTDLAAATANAISSSYIVPPHDDSGKACELIAFANRNGKLPDGHKWYFAACGMLFQLPEHEGGSALIFVKGDGVYHGTLPTSSVKPTYAHGNLGTALVNPSHTMDAMLGNIKKKRKFTTERVGKEFTASFMFNKRDEDNNQGKGYFCVHCKARGNTYYEVYEHERSCRSAFI